MRNHVVHAVGGGQVHRLEGLGHRPHLIDLDQHGVGRSEFNPLRQTFGLSDKEIVSNGLDAVTVGFGEGRPAPPVVFTKPVFDGKNGVPVEPPPVQFNEVVRGQHLPVHVISIVLQELR